MAGRWIIALVRKLISHHKWCTAITHFYMFWVGIFSDGCEILSRIEEANRRYAEKPKTMAYSTMVPSSLTAQSAHRIESEEAAETASIGAAAVPYLAMQSIN